MQLSDYHGKVSKCPTCTNPDAPMDCKNCLCRGFVASCIACGGGGQVRERVAGATEGYMSSTCNKCGGCGTFPVNKPANWDEEAKEPVVASGDLVAPVAPEPDAPAVTDKPLDSELKTLADIHAAHVASGEPDENCPECIAATEPATT